MFGNTYRDPTGCYGDLHGETYPQNVEETEKMGPTNGAGLAAWNMHASGPSVHNATHAGHPAHSSATPHYHSAFHHHPGTAAMEMPYGYALTQVWIFFTLIFILVLFCFV